LLKGTVPGKSDNRLLQGAVERLDGLISLLDQRMAVDVGAGGSRQSEIPLEMEDEVVIDMRARDSTDGGQSELSA
jgi:hypothetical protein